MPAASPLHPVSPLLALLVCPGPAVAPACASAQERLGEQGGRTENSRALTGSWSPHSKGPENPVCHKALKNLTPLTPEHSLYPFTLIYLPNPNVLHWGWFFCTSCGMLPRARALIFNLLINVISLVRWMPFSLLFICLMQPSL